MKIECREGDSYSTKEDQCVFSSLSKELPHLKIDAYYNAKPNLLQQSDFVVTASTEQSRAVALLCANVMETEAGAFAHILTIFIASRYQGTPLFRFIWASLFSNILDKYPQFVEALSLKTYNPISLSLFLKTASRADAKVYPIDHNLSGCESLLLDQVMKYLGPFQSFDTQRGIIFGGAGKVPVDFYPALPKARDRRIMNLFSPPLTAKDRLLSVMFLRNKINKEHLLNQFNLSMAL